MHLCSWYMNTMITRNYQLLANLMSNTTVLACSRGIIQLDEPLSGQKESCIALQLSSTLGRKIRSTLAGPTQKLMQKLRQSPMLRGLNERSPITVRTSFLQDKPIPTATAPFLALLNAKAKESDAVPLELPWKFSGSSIVARYPSTRSGGDVASLLTTIQ